MRLFVLLVFALALALPLVACADTANDNDNDDADTAHNETAQTTAAVCFLKTTSMLSVYRFYDKYGCSWGYDPKTFRILTEYGPSCPYTIPIGDIKRILKSQKTRREPNDGEAAGDNVAAERN